MRKKPLASEYSTAEALIDLGTVVIQQEKRITRLGRLLLLAILGGSALGTYLIIKNNS